MFAFLVLLRLTYKLNPAKLPPVLLEDPAVFLCGAMRGEQFNCQPKVRVFSPQNFPFKYGFGIIALLNCAKRTMSLNAISGIGAGAERS